VHWLYIHADSDIHSVYGQGDYTITQAENASIPGELPSEVEDFSLLAAKVIVQKSATGFTSIVTAYRTPFPVSTPSDHNDLGGLDTGNYQHLTSAEHDEVTQWADSVTLDTSGTVNIPAGQEYQINGANVKIDDWGTADDNTDLDATTGAHGLMLKFTGVENKFLSATGGFVATPGATGGEANTASNAGTTGVGIYYQKTGIDLEFKAIHSTGNILVTDSTGTITVNLDVDSTGILLDNLGAPEDNTDLNATTGAHGLLLKMTGTATDYLSATGGWTTPAATGAATTFLELTDTPSDYLLDASKLLRVNSASGAVEFISSTGVQLDNLGPTDDNTDLDATTGTHGLVPKFTAVDTDYLSATGGYTAPAGVGNVISSGDFNATRLAEISSSADAAIIASPFTVTTGDVLDFGAHSAVFTEQAIATTTGTASINWNSGLKALFTRSTGAAGVVTFSFTAPVKSANLMLTVRGSSVGSTGTVTWPVIKWDGGSAPSLGSGASAINVASFYYSTGLTSYLGQCSTGTFSS